MTASDWDAETYSRVASPQLEWSADVIARLRLHGDETVLDAGCGSGGVTAGLLDVLPRGHVVAVDGSPAMIEAARTRLGNRRVSFHCQDLSELTLDRPVDHAFSNSTFHWIPDHAKLFSRLNRAIRPGGRLVAQCGGPGNVTEIVRGLEIVTREEPFRDDVGELEAPWNFADPDETESRLIAAGFAEPHCWLEKRLAIVDDPQRFVEASCLAPYRERLDQDLFRQFSDRLMEAMGYPENFSYVRLNMDATRGTGQVPAGGPVFNSTGKGERGERE